MALATAKFLNLTRAEGVMLWFVDVNNFNRGEFALAGSSSRNNDPFVVKILRIARAMIIRRLATAAVAATVRNPGHPRANFEAAPLRSALLLEMNRRVADALAKSASTEYGDQYFRTTPRFETGDPRYAWLNQSIFVAEGRLGPSRVDYNVYRVT